MGSCPVSQGSHRDRERSPPLREDKLPAVHNPELAHNPVQGHSLGRVGSRRQFRIPAQLDSRRRQNRLVDSQCLQAEPGRIRDFHTGHRPAVVVRAQVQGAGRALLQKGSLPLPRGAGGSLGSLVNVLTSEFERFAGANERAHSTQLCHSRAPGERRWQQPE